MRILVLGGHGNFGARVCRALRRDSIEVIAASRDPDRGHRIASFGGEIGKARIDLLDPHFASALRNLAPAIVIHCVGPFQDQDYRVADAALKSGAHYIDLADGRAFVAGFAAAVDPLARASGLLAVSGASTLPALSCAVIDHLLNRFSSLQEIELFIAPAQRAPRGAATIRSVFSYLGEPFKWLKDGAWQTAYGWQELKRVQLGGMRPRWAAACDVPDLELLPARYRGVRTVQFRAALELGIQHFFLAAVATLRRAGVSIPLDRWSVPLDRAAGWLNRFGSELGGMLVRLEGTGVDGRRHRVEWHLTADHNHGPEIPCMAAILLAQKLARGEVAARGAMPCTGLLTLDEFAPEFARWGIQTAVEDQAL